jgi:hypothetical protein
LNTSSNRFEVITQNASVERAVDTPCGVHFQDWPSFDSNTRRGELHPSIGCKSAPRARAGLCNNRNSLLATLGVLPVLISKARRRTAVCKSPLCSGAAQSNHPETPNCDSRHKAVSGFVLLMECRATNRVIVLFSNFPGRGNSLPRSDHGCPEQNRSCTRF